MKILRVIITLDPAYGGPVATIKPLSQVLSDRGHQIEIACLDSPKCPWLKDFPFKVYAFGPGILKYKYSRHFLPWLRQNANQYDCVIIHGLWNYSGFAVWQALHNSSIPYFVYLHGMLAPWFNRRYPLSYLKKQLYWPWGEYRVLRDAKAVLCTSEEERILAGQTFWPYQCNAVVVNYGTAIPIGNAENQKQVFFKSFPKLEQLRLLLFLGRLHFTKGCDLLVEAFAQVAKTDDRLHLVMAGPDELSWQEKLQSRAQKLGVDQRITWTGTLVGDLKWGALNAAEVFILPSHQDNHSVAMVEAMACSVPVLISNQVYIWREIVADGAGLVADDTVAGTVELLERWLAMSPGEQQTMKENAWRSFNERFEVQSAAQSLIDVIQD